MEVEPQLACPDPVTSKGERPARGAKLSSPDLSFLFETMIANRFPVDKWEELGKKLGMSKHDLSSIEDEPYERRFLAVIYKWRRNSSTTIPGHLLEALKSIDENYACAVERKWLIPCEPASGTVHGVFVPFNNMPLDRPLSITHLQALEEQLRTLGFSPTQWFTLGLALGLNYMTLDDIGLDNRGDCEQCFWQVLTAWIDGDDYTCWRGPATLERLCHVLKEMELNDVAQKIQQKFSQNQVNESYTNPDVEIHRQPSPWRTEDDVINEGHIPFIVELLGYLNIKGNSRFFLRLGLSIHEIRVVEDDVKSSGGELILKLLEKWIDKKADEANVKKLSDAISCTSPEKGRRFKAIVEGGGFFKQIAGKESTKSLPLKDGASGDLPENVLTDLFVYIIEPTTHISHSKWHRMGQELGLDGSLLNGIEKEGVDCGSKFVLVIWRWVNNWASRPGSSPPTQQHLIAALKTIDGAASAENLKAHFGRRAQNAVKPVLTRGADHTLPFEQLRLDTLPFEQLRLNTPFCSEHQAELFQLLKSCRFGTIEWFCLGILMRLDIAELLAIQKNNNRNVIACMREVLEHWLEGRGRSLEAGLPTPELLIKLVHSCNQHAAAENLECYFKRKSRR
ncbi:hypothetical protein M3P05_11000 [Sansalvadorimonas sp. 2012CJ34-2]|uniref:Death domain-containing protein n=1 Tax=Parendozoicomonas callyspongiae TaxID=2942213 RepID=A0ABT0PIZ0_9GAMM|nr:hypothetical protein [Sansalvadorimonas sp. 2012CJ34-2]MCL6270448.1 hypothetical protein [Sansalvadorimonas sp. 2012CJ34-2]